MKNVHGDVPLSKLPREIFQKRDIFGRTVLHIAVLANNVNDFKALLRSPEARHVILSTDYENGWNILHYIFYHKRLACLNVLLEHLELAASGNATTLAELLKRKDRSRVPPLALLQNDLKDLVWVPQYINERNEYHLIQRFNTTSDLKQKHLLLPRRIDHDWWLDTRGGLHVYVFGSNGNNHLGVGDSTDRSVPSRVSFREFQPPVTESSTLQEIVQKPRFKLVRVSKYHSLVVTTDGRLFTCGMGARGRLGHGNAANLYRYKQVELLASEEIENAAISNNHNVVLTANNEIYAWGLNSYNQLGFTSVLLQSFKSTPELYENSPKLVNCGDLRKNSRRIKGIATSKIHSVAYTSNSVFVWGLNIGQMGLGMPESTSAKDNDHRVNGITYKGDVIAQPKEATLRDDIVSVSTSETCTCIVTVTNDIYVYFLGQRVKLPKLPARAFSEANFDRFKPSRLTSAPIIKKVVFKSHENIHILLESGDVMSFSLSLDDVKSLRNVRYSYVWRAYDSDMRAVDIDNSYDGSVIVCTKNGSVFLSSSNSIQRKGSVSTLLMPGVSSTKQKFKKVEHVNRACRVSCDETFSSFAVIRDDVDVLPLKLQKNDFFKDLAYLNALSEQDLYRKQDQLLDVDHNENSYISKYLYPLKPSSAADDDHSFLIKRLGKDFSRLEVADNHYDDSDYVREQQRQKYDFTKNTAPSFEDSFQESNADVIRSIKDLLRSESEAITLLKDPDAFSSKFCDGRIKFGNRPDIVIGFHTKLLEYRSTFCKQIFNPTDDGEYFVHESIRGFYDPTSKTITFESDVDVRATLVVLYFMYTNEVADFWDQYPSGLNCPEDIRKLKSDYFKLMDLFRMDSLYGKKEAFVKQLQEMSEDKSDGDIILNLSEGDEICRSAMLVARSAFFETILSGRWETGKADETSFKYVSMENVSELQNSIILRHLHGCDDLTVFDGTRNVVAETADSDDFVNILLDMIEVADELLLVQLKHLCELAIQEFISIENVLILLAHADWLGAHKLFMSCCWYIYNNLEIVLFDGNLRNLDDTLVGRLEEQICFLGNCRLPDFVLGEKGEVNHGLNENVLQLPTYHAVEMFVTDMGTFNEIYMSDRKGFSSFQPLRDVKLDGINSEESRRKLSSRRMSRRGSTDPLSELRRISNFQLLERSVSESAVADEEEFELVTNRKRRSKLKAKAEEPTRERSPTANEGSVSPVQQSLPSPQPLATKMEAAGSVSSSASSFAWVSRNSSSASITKVQTTPSGRDGAEQAKRQTKIKFAPSMKLSQKQRKKLAQQEPELLAVEGSSNSLPLKNPWRAVPASGPAISKVEADLPVLGQPKEQTPSLTAIMLQESTRLEEQKILESQQQTLQEIQQEQEFARWWEEESKRVQGAGGSKGSGPSNGKRRGSRKKSLPSK